MRFIAVVVSDKKANNHENYQPEQCRQNTEEGKVLAVIELLHRVGVRLLREKDSGKDRFAKRQRTKDKGRKTGRITFGWRMKN